MTPLPDSDHQVEPGERFIDAAIHEHARNGGDSDDELVHRILSETVNKSALKVSPKGPRLDRQTLFVGSAAVAALLALTVLILSSLSFSPERGTDEFFFSTDVRHVGTIDDPLLSGLQKRVSITAQPFDGPIDPVASSMQLDTIELSAGSDLQFIEPFSPSLKTFPTRSERQRSFRVSADEIDRSGSSIYYTGNVVIEHDEFRIEAGSVTVHRDGSDRPQILATTVSVEQPTASRSVSARSMTFDPVAVEMRLAGVHLFSADTGEHHLDPGDTLVLTASAYAVENSKTFQYATPSPNSSN